MINARALHEAVLARVSGRGLITVSNHTSTLDDPMLVSSILPWSLFTHEHVTGRNRWTLCAKEVCFKNQFYADFFRSGKTLPVERGAGLMQPAIHHMTRQLARGDWIHLFPEGRIVYRGNLGLPLRWGVGKVICDAIHMQTHGEDGLIQSHDDLAKFQQATTHTATNPNTTSTNSGNTDQPKPHMGEARLHHQRIEDSQRETENASGGENASSSSSSSSSSSITTTSTSPVRKECSSGSFPVIVPFHHAGMGDVMPLKSIYPRVGKKVTVVVGDPLVMDDVLCKCAVKGGSTPDVWMEIASRIEQRMVQLERMAPQNTDQLTKLGLTEADVLKRRPKPSYANLATRWRDAKHRAIEKAKTKLQKVKERMGAAGGGSSDHKSSSSKSNNNNSSSSSSSSST